MNSKRRSFGDVDCKLSLIHHEEIKLIDTLLLDDDRFNKKARLSTSDESIEDKLDELIVRIGEKVKFFTMRKFILK